MVQHQCFIHVFRCIVYLNRLRSDIGTFQHGNTLQCLLCLRFILVFFQMLCVCCDLLYRFRWQRCLIGGKFIFQFFLSLGCKSAFRIDHHNRCMWVVQKILFDQFFKIPLFRLLFQTFKNIQFLQMVKGFAVIIQPAVKHINAVHKPFGEGRKVSFPESEFQKIDSCGYGFFVNSFFCNFSERLLNQIHKGILVLWHCIFCHNREKWLENAVIIGSKDIFPHSGIQKRLLKRCPRS